MYDEMSISDLLGVAHQQAHPDDQPSAEHAPLIDELIVRLRRLDEWRTLVSTEINPYLTDDDGGDLVSEHHRIRYMLQRLSRNSLPPAGGEVAGPSEEEWNKFVYSLWDKYDFAGEPFTWSDFCKALNDARSSLTLWGNHSADASKMVSPAPVPTEGEVAELIAWLGDEADQYDCIQQAPETVRRLRRAANPLEQHHPTPVPVSERLPEARDCLGRPTEASDAGWCWTYSDASERWSFQAVVFPRSHPNPPLVTLKPSVTHWLPHYALPLPALEVE